MKKHDFSCIGYICTCSKTEEILQIHKIRFEDLMCQFEELGFQKALNQIEKYIHQYDEGSKEQIGLIDARDYLRDWKYKILAEDAK